MTPPAAVWIRHGTSNDGLIRPAAHARPDTPLSDQGRNEARRAADRLHPLRPGRIVTSPLPRAADTARILAEHLGIPLADPEPLLTEWRAPDCVLGLAPADYPPEYQRWRDIRGHDPDSALPGGESLTAFAERTATADDLVNSLTGAKSRPVLVVTHRLLIGAVAAHTVGTRDPAELFAAASRFPLRPGEHWLPS